MLFDAHTRCLSGFGGVKADQALIGRLATMDFTDEAHNADGDDRRSLVAFAHYRAKPRLVKPFR